MLVHPFSHILSNIYATVTCMYIYHYYARTAHNTHTLHRIRKSGEKGLIGRSAWSSVPNPEHHSVLRGTVA
jgi:hypothetical protein